jgi:hypothetical protein
MTDAVIVAGARTPIGRSHRGSLLDVDVVIGRVERRAAPFSESWPAWRPDPWWGRPELPADWDVVQA